MNLTPNGHEDREGNSKVVIEQVGHFHSVTVQDLKVATVTSRTHQEILSVAADTVSETALS